MERSIVLEGKKTSFYRSKSKIAKLDLLSFLKAQEIYPKMYWNERSSNEERIVIGSFLELDHLPTTFEGGPDIRLYGGHAFSDSLHFSSVWDEFPKSHFFLPRYEILQTDSETHLITISLHEHENSLVWDYQPVNEETPSVKDRTDTPSQNQWTSLIEQILFEIRQNTLRKVVLARQTTIQCFSSVDSYVLLKSLKEKKHNTTVFLLQLNPRSAFIGSTPEKLYKKEGSLLHTEALAGTLPRGATKEKDLYLQNLLLQSVKEQNEVAKVGIFLEKLLQHLGKDVQQDSSYSIFQTPNVHHLYKKFSCKIDETISHATLLKAIHPTPAVGGTPRDASLLHIEKREPFDRGWYAAPIGWISECSADLAVAIRSALIKEDTIHLFAGAGIVEASDPEKEWRELENKISQFTEYFYALKRRQK